MKNRKQKKVEGLEKISGFMANHQLMIVLQNGGVKVDRMWELKGKLRAGGGDCFIEKNKIVSLAADRIGVKPQLESMLDGPNIFVFGKEEQIAEIAKSVCEFSKSEPTVKVMGGGLFVDGKNETLSAADVERISKLPSKDTLRGQIVGILQAPQSKIISIFGAAQRDMVCILKNYLKKNNS